MDGENSLSESPQQPQEENLQVARPKRRFSTIFVLLSVLVLLLWIGLGFLLLRSKGLVMNTKPQGAIISPPPLSEQKATGDYTIIMKDNPSNRTQSDIYLKDIQSGKEDFFMSLTDVYKQHYHNAEFKDGYVYVIRRIGYDEFNTANNNWTDELWRYTKQKQGRKIFANKGLDFRVAPDGKFIAIVGSGSKNIVGENLTLLDNTGRIIKTYVPETVGMENFNAVEWSGQYFWVSDSFGPSISILLKLNAETLKSTTYKLPTFIGPEYALNTTREKIAYSTFPAIFDVDGEKDFEQSGKEVLLQVYDLNSKKNEIIDRSITKRFMPHWINSTTLEYDNPKGEGKVRKTF